MSAVSPDWLTKSAAVPGGERAARGSGIRRPRRFRRAGPRPARTSTWRPAWHSRRCRRRPSSGGRCRRSRCPGAGRRIARRRRGSGERVGEARGLLGDLLGHEVAVAALVGGAGAGRDGLRGAVGGRPSRSRICAGRVMHGPVALLQVGDAVGQGGEGDGVGADVDLARRRGRWRAASPGGRRSSGRPRPRRGTGARRRPRAAPSVARRRLGGVRPASRCASASIATTSVSVSVPAKSPLRGKGGRGARGSSR